MLPFLKPKPQTGVLIRERAPDGDIEEKGFEDHALKAAAADLIHAIHAKDEDAVAAAWRAGFEILESQPHEEAEHDEQS